MTTTTTGIALAGEGAAISAADDRVKYGRNVTLSGTVPESVGEPVTIAFRPQGTEQFAPVKTTETDQAGAFRAKVRAERTGDWRAEPTAGAPSDAETVEVRSLIRWSVRRHVLRGNAIRVHGRVLPAAGRRLTIRLGGRKRTKTTGEKGGFDMRLRTHHTGSYPVRATVDGDELALGRSKRTHAFAYRSAFASWYGPGLYGNRLACGGTLKPSTLGVAHKRLPCGSKVRLRYHGRGIVVRVVDRGPFVAGREFDLTAATKRRLHFPSTGSVWTTR